MTNNKQMSPKKTLFDTGEFGESTAINSTYSNETIQTETSSEHKTDNTQLVSKLSPIRTLKSMTRINTSNVNESIKTGSISV